MIWLPQIPHFMMDVSAAIHLDRDVIRDVNAIGRGQQLLQAARLGAGWHLQVHRDGGTLLARDEQGLSRGHVSSLAPRPARLWPRNAEEEFTDDMRAREFCCRIVHS